MGKLDIAIPPACMGGLFFVLDASPSLKKLLSSLQKIALFITHFPDVPK
jgi:hypothetical protein